ncbi:MAG: GNAT family N-acetyltransferase [Sideroxyarcus sp.]|nr:GNAT family N-acetyltransferase [Sideroxyarcus sp.]
MSTFREIATKIIRKLVSPSTRFELRESAAWLREQLDRACLWRWEIVRLPQRHGSPHEIVYVGRKAHRVELANTLPTISGVFDTNQANATQSSQTVFVSEMPIPGALCVPQFLNTIIPLGRPIEAILAEYDDKLHRSLLKQRLRYHLRQARSTEEVDQAYRDMLHPFAAARHGNSAVQRSSEAVRRSALGYGRLDFLLSEDEVVGCMLGNESVRKGKRYWVTDRCGYPEAVYTDLKRFGEINSINHHLAIEHAIENGFDYCELGRCFANPDNGLLQHKRHRGAKLDMIGLRGYGYFHIRLPRVGAAQFLWDTPLFAVENRKLTLHLGLPDGIDDEEFSKRYRQMGFGGLFKIYLHCARVLGERVPATLHDLYCHQNPPPIVKTIPST